MLKKAIVFDLDGTLADLQHRLPHIDKVVKFYTDGRMKYGWVLRNSKDEEISRSAALYASSDTALAAGDAENKKDYRAFFAACEDDAVIEPIAMVFRALRAQRECAILIASGRSDECKEATMAWLSKYDLSSYHPIYMRKAGDRRPDYKIKSEMLNHMVQDGFAPILAFDDRDQVVNMWRANGIPCAQVAPGDF